MSIYSTLLARGYFPKELPPAFTTEEFAAFAVTSAGRRVLKAYCPPRHCTECVEYKLALPGSGGLAHRTLRIPHPLSYVALARLVATDFQRLLRKAGTSSISRSRPVYEAARTRALRTLVQPSNLARERALSRATASYLLKVDVSQFYPSLYAHAVGWAIDARLRDRTQWQNRALLGKKIDQCLMDMQGKVSQGIPIGPDISFLLAELVLGQVDRASRLPKDRSYRWFDDYEIACSSRQEAESTLARLTSVLGSFRLRPNPLKTTIVELPRASGERWQIELAALGAQSIATASKMAAFFDQAFGLRVTYPEQPVLMYAMGLLFGLRRPPEHVRRVAESCISQALLAEPGCTQKAFALLTYWHLNHASFDRVLATKTIERLCALHKSRGVSSDVAWALAFAIEHGLALDREVGRCFRCVEDDAVTIQALHANALGLLPAFDVRKVLRALGGESCDGEHWLAIYEGVRLGYLPGLSQRVQANALMGALLSAKVLFYRTQLRPYAMLLHPGGAPPWMVDGWVKSLRRRRKKGARVLPVERLLETDFRSADATLRTERNLLRLLRHQERGLEVALPEPYEQ